MRKVQKIAKRARNILQALMSSTGNTVKLSLNEMTAEFELNAKSDSYTKVDLTKWSRQLSVLRKLLEKSCINSMIIKRQKALRYS